MMLQVLNGMLVMVVDVLGTTRATVPKVVLQRIHVRIRSLSEPLHLQGLAGEYTPWARHPRPGRTLQLLQWVQLPQLLTLETDG